MLRSQYFTPAALMRIASYASVVTAIVLITAKLLAWYLSDAVSILASLIDSSLDLLASLVNLLAIRHALQPADKEHRFGHGKAEPLAALGQAMFIAGSAAMLLFQASSRLIHPQPLASGIELGLIVMVFSIIATTLLIILQRYVIKKTNSSAIRADSLHYQSDLLINVSIIVALLLTHYGWLWFDPVMAMLIGFYVLLSAWKIFRDAIDLLMDHEITDTERQQIIRLANSHPQVRGMHDLRTRRSGTRVFIQLHLELDPHMQLQQAHDVSNAVSQKIQALFDDAEIIIHQDPLNDSAIEPPFA